MAKLSQTELDFLTDLAFLNLGVFDGPPTIEGVDGGPLPVGETGTGTLSEVAFSFGDVRLIFSGEIVLFAGFITAAATFNQLSVTAVGASTVFDFDEPQNLANAIAGVTNDRDFFSRLLSGDDEVIISDIARDVPGAEPGVAVVNGFDGNDTLRAFPGDGNFLEGGSGQDDLIGGPGDDFLNGGDDNDDFFTSDGLDEIDGGQGEDLIVYERNVDAFDISVNQDEIIISRTDSVDIVKNVEFFDFGAERLTLAQVIEQAMTAPTVLGTGDDVFTIIGDGGEVDGGAGNDEIIGGGGSDVLIGGVGNDTLTCGGGADRAEGGRGSDSISGGRGADTLMGNGGRDDLDGGGGSDALFGGGGRDQLIGRGGRDTLDGGGGRDALQGGGGRDVLIGGGGRDSVDGGGGRDSLTGGRGRDTLEGGGGADNFFLAQGDGLNFITDFNLRLDTLTFITNDPTASIEDVTIGVAGDDALLRFGSVTARLEGLAANAPALTDSTAFATVDDADAIF